MLLVVGRLAPVAIVTGSMPAPNLAAVTAPAAIAADAVTAGKIQAGAITANKLAANAIAVGTAAVENGAINNAMIGNAAIDDAKIANLSAAKLTAGDGTIGGNLKSSTYSAVLQQGWIIRPDGFAEFNDIVVRGTVFASQGAIGGSLIGSSYIQSTNWVNLSTGWRWNNDGTGQVGGIAILSDRIQSGNYSENAQGFAWRADGTGQIGGLKVTATGIESSNFVSGSAGLRMNFDGQVEMLNLFARGNIQATSLNAATGTFSGTLTADAVDAVRSINIAGEAVIVPRRGVFVGNKPSGSTVTLFTLPAITYEKAGKAVLFLRIGTFSEAPVFVNSISVTQNGTSVYSTGLFQINSGGSNPRRDWPMFTVQTNVSAGNNVFAVVISGGNTSIVLDIELTVMGVTAA